MSDFFETLERQLLQAARERPERLRRARARARGAVAGAAAAAVLVAGGAGIAVGVSGDRGGGPDGGAAGGATTTATDADGRSTTPAGVPRRQRFAIAVLNGTTTPGLAGGVANALLARGFAVRVVTNAADQTVERTRVAFRDGHEQDAALVYGALFPGKSGDLWRPTPSQSALAGSEPDVIVVVGNDYAVGRRQP